MITKSLGIQGGHRSGRYNQQVLVTFELPDSIWAEHIALVGDFNNWNPITHSLVQTHRNENWHITLCLEPGRSYRFRYLIDNEEWVNDPDADKYSSALDSKPCSVVVIPFIHEQTPKPIASPA
ncbi:MAG: glycoside hydrolase family 13 [Chloroflexi bacterium]|nr:glycoside hydrolase family 13 [Chloroflexota bacterium]